MKEIVNNYKEALLKSHKSENTVYAYVTDVNLYVKYLKMEESVLSKTIVKDLKVLAKTNFLSLYNADYINKGGKEKTWTIATRKSKEALEEQFFQGKEDKMDAVVILAYHKEEKKLVAIKQFRVPLNNYVYELPAGLIDNNDDITI